MIKPNALSVGIGLGVLMLGGSGFAIPNLWSRANRAEIELRELKASWQESRQGRAASDEALQRAQQELAELRKQVDEDRRALDDAQDSNRVLTNQLAETQARNRELEATSGTLELRDQEVAELVRQLAQLRSDHESLLAQRQADSATEDAGPPAAGKATGQLAETATNAVTANKTASQNSVPADLVPVPPRTLTDSGDAVASRGGASATSQTAAKPPATRAPATRAPATRAPATKPLRFDDSGWKSVAPGSSGATVYWFPVQ